MRVECLQPCLIRTFTGDDDVAKLEEIKKYLLSLDLSGYKPVEVVEFEVRWR